MSALIDIQQPGDVVYTALGGTLRAWKVASDGRLVEVDAATCIG